MLVVQNIIANKQAYIEALAKRNFDGAPVLEKVIALDEDRRATQAKLDNTLADSNKFSKEIGMLFKNGEQQKANLLKEKTAQLKESSKELSTELTDIQEKLVELLYTIPNIPHDSVPNGQSDEDNEEVFKEGEIPTLEEGALPHWELAKKYDIIDFELGVKITGAGFPVYKGKGARLQRALINYFFG